LKNGFIQAEKRFFELC
jgi:protein phosphatase 2C family protein 2/3